MQKKHLASPGVFCLFRDVSEESCFACLLDCLGNLALVLGRKSAATSWDDLHVRRAEATKELYIFVVNISNVVGFEVAISFFRFRLVASVSV